MARWLEASYYFVKVGFAVDVVAAATWAVGNSDVFGTVAAVVEVVNVAAVLDTAKFAGAA